MNFEFSRNFILLFILYILLFILHLNAHLTEINRWHHNRHRWVPLCASFTDVRISLTIVQGIVHQCTKYLRIVPSKVVNNVSQVIKKCVDIASWYRDIAGQCSGAKCPEHCVAMHGTLIIDIQPRASWHAVQGSQLSAHVVYTIFLATRSKVRK